MGLIKVSRKDALSCWVNTCPPHSIWWEKVDLGVENMYEGTCKKCEIEYSIGGTIDGGMVVSKGTWEKIQELNK